MRLLLCIFLLFFFVPAVQAAVAIDATSSVHDNNPTSLTVSHTTSGSDRLMLVGVSLWNEDYESVSSVSYGGTSLTRIGFHQRSDDSRVEIWGLVAPPAVSASVSVNFSSRANSGAGFGVVTFTGVDQSSPYGSTVTNNGDSYSAGLNIPSIVDGMVFAVMASEYQDDYPNASSVFNEHWNYKWNGNNRLSGGGGTAAGTGGTVSIAWDLENSEDWAMIGLPLNPSSVVPPVSLYDCNGDVTYGLPKMEVAAFTVIDTYSHPISTTVNFTQDFDSAPLVFTLPTTQGSNAAAHRIRNVTSSGFEIMTVEPEGEDGPHIAMGLNFLAVEPGVYVLPDGHRLEACSFSTTQAQQFSGGDDWGSINFISDFNQTPAMLGQIQTMNNEVGGIPAQPSTPWLTTAISGVSVNTAKVALERSESLSGNIATAERIAYLAAEPTSGRQSFDIDDMTVDYEILRSDPVVLGWGNCQSIYYSVPWTNDGGSRIRPIPLASMNTRGGDAEGGEDDGGWFRRCRENSVNNESMRVRLSIDEVRQGSYNTDGNRSKTVGERAGIFIFSDNFVTQSVSLDHIRFIHSATGVTCLPTTVRVYACENTDCTSLYSGNVTLNMTPSGANSTWTGPNLVGDQVEFTGGFVELQLNHYQPGEIRLRASGTPVPANSDVCLIGGTGSDCTMDFYDSGFVFDVSDHVSATSQSVTLAAVRTDDTTQQCVPSFEDVTRRLTFNYNYTNPASGSVPIVISGNSIASSGAGVNLIFNSDGEASFPFTYADVGDVSLTATYIGSAANDDIGLTMTGDDSFVTRPDHFVVTVPGNPGASDATGSVFMRAGADFSIEVSARNADGGVTPNYGKETVPEDVSLTVSLVAPAGQHSPALSGSFGAFGTNCDGINNGGHACGQFSWPEVGIVTLVPKVADDNYLGTGNATGNVSGNVGRFIPDRFTVSKNNPIISDACISGNFTYIGQPFTFLISPQLTLNAVAEDGAITQNYGNSFWRFNSNFAGRAYSHSPAAGFPGINIATAGSVDLNGHDDYDGMGTVTINNEWLNYVKPVSAQSPFDSNIDLIIPSSSLIDSDDVCYDVDADGNCDSYTLSGVGDSEQRYGRLLLQNAYGPEMRPLTIPVLTEFFNGTAFVPNDLDSCTAYNAAEILMGTYQGNLEAGDTVGTGIGSLTAGVGNALSLSAPGVENDGSVQLTLDLSQVTGLDLEWLQPGGVNPTATATFGIYQGNPRLIYMRESIW